MARRNCGKQATIESQGTWGGGGEVAGGELHGEVRPQCSVTLNVGNVHVPEVVLSLACTLHQKVKDIMYRYLYCVVDICYTCTHSIYELHQKVNDI